MSAILLTLCETLAAHNCEGTEQLHKIIINSILLLTNSSISRTVSGIGNTF